MGKIVNKRDLALIVGTSERTLTDWQRDGMPMLEDNSRGKSNQYDTEQVIRWMVMREMSKLQSETQRDRLARLQADNIELDIAVKRGTLVSVDQVLPAWLSMVASAKSYLRAEPDRMAQMLEVTDGVDAKRDLLQETFDEFLRKLSTYEPDADEADGLIAPVIALGSQNVCATTEDDGGSMG